MSFNKSYELKKFEAHWEKLRIEYAAAGMTEDAIQKMYDYDRQQFNVERTHLERTQELSTDTFECSEDENSPLMKRYREVTTVTDTYHETKSGFAWIGEIENERLLSALENLSGLDLKILTLYVYAGYTESEIAGELGGSKVAIHKRIEKITKLLKKF
jgi:DNA-directed RNA polymerase specialized sigma subunit